MKKIIFLVFASVLLVACGGGGNSSSSGFAPANADAFKIVYIQSNTVNKAKTVIVNNQS